MVYSSDFAATSNPSQFNNVTYYKKRTKMAFHNCFHFGRSTDLNCTLSTDHSVL